MSWKDRRRLMKIQGVPNFFLANEVWPVLQLSVCPPKKRAGWWITTCYVRVFRYGACQRGQWRRPFPARQPGQEIGEASFDPPPASSLGPHGCDLQRMQIDGSQKVFFGVSQHRCHVIKLFQSLSTISQSETYFSFQDTAPLILTHPVNLEFIPVIGQKKSVLSFLLRSGFESRIWSSFVCTQCKIHSSTACTNWGVSKWRCSKRVALRPATCESDLKSAASSIPPPLKTWKPSWGTTSTAGPTWRRTTQKTHPSNFTRLQTEQIRPLRVILYDSPSFRPRSRDISLGSHFFLLPDKKVKAN